MKLFLNDYIKGRNNTEYKEIKEYNQKIDKRLLEYKAVLGRYRDCLSGFEAKIEQYEKALEEKREKAEDYKASMEKLFLNYDEKVQWYEEQQDVYARKAKDESIMLEQAALDIDDLKVRMNRVCIQLEDMKENQVDKMNEDIQMLLAKQEDLKDLMESLDISIADRMVLNNTELRNEMVQNLEEVNQELSGKNRKLLTCVRLLLFFQLLSFSAIIFIILLITDIIIY